jgi:predicted hotdog family 3-hydroxylacyl-ACP dehydratase
VHSIFKVHIFVIENTFPVSVKQLVELVPHRGTAIWIDEVTNLTESGGECQVYAKDAPYITAGKVRPSSYIEFMAQSYAYVSACHFLYRPKPFQKKITEAFLVGIRDLEIVDLESIEIGQALKISVQRSHELGDLVLIDGVVSSSEGKCIAKGQLKLFAR